MLGHRNNSWGLPSRDLSLVEQIGIVSVICENSNWSSFKDAFLFLWHFAGDTDYPYFTVLSSQLLLPYLLGVGEGMEVDRVPMSCLWLVCLPDPHRLSGVCEGRWGRQMWWSECMFSFLSPSVEEPGPALSLLCLNIVWSHLLFSDQSFCPHL